MDDVEDLRDTLHEAYQARKIAYHDTFVKSKAGGKVLAEWVNSYCMGGIPGNNATERECGKRDGKQELIKMIIDLINTGEQT